MNTFFIAVIVLMIIVTFWWVLKPMLNTNLQSNVAQLHNQQLLEELDLQRSAIYAAIKDMEMDFESGKMSESDFQQGRLKFMQQAAGILKQIDTLTTADETHLDAQIEDLLENVIISEETRASARANIENQRAILQSTLDDTNLVCPKCGETVHADDVFCSHCGTSLSIECPACHKKVLAGDKFCPHCGTAMPHQEVA